ncbi:unnamed protein product, partial [Mesorhabditis belari]|uniref:Rapamycin-insensitive companion of mTOR N-terminal domain-containing protein n=1 Tax=Mesorhabditis belari TaxID=2138241 RepID=A0AAF3F787_9BILA
MWKHLIGLLDAGHSHLPGARALVGRSSDEIHRQSASSHPSMREFAYNTTPKALFQQIFAPLVEYGFFQTSNIESQDHRPLELPLDKYSASFLAIMRSWAGIFACGSVDSTGQVMNGSPLRLLDYLGMGVIVGENLLKIRDMVVDIACEFVDRPYAHTKFNSWKEALTFYAKQDISNVSRGLLSDEFILSEFDAMQYTKSDHNDHMDFLIAFRAMAAFSLISAGLAQSLARLIVAHPDDPSALKATLLLSDVSWISSSFVPIEWRNVVLSLPTLVQSAAETIAKNSAPANNDPFDIASSETTFLNAGNAMLVLYRMDELTKIRLSFDGRLSPTSNYSLFVASDKQADKTNGCDMSQLSMTVGEALNGNLQWKAAIVALSTALREPQKATKTCGEKLLLLVQKIFNWMSPLEPRFKSNDRDATLAAKRAIRYACHFSSDEYYRDMLMGFAGRCFQELTEDRLSFGCFSTKQMVTSGSAFYFALLGEMSKHPAGLEALNTSGIMLR